MRFPLVVTVFSLPSLYAGILELKPETLASWDDYIQKAKSVTEERYRAGKSFLWTDEDQDRSARVRRGEVVVWPARDNSPKCIPSGLIHDWIGAAFVPNATINDLFSIVHDYSSYKDVYKPGVLSAKLTRREEGDDYFSMLLRNGSYFTRTVIEGEFHSSRKQLDEKRWYNVSCSSRLQEIDNYGQPGEHKLPVDEGHGYIWRMCGISHMEERDGGVYIEEELIALSRDVPAALRWMAGPIIRRVAKESLALSIEKTRTAVAGKINPSGVNVPTVTSKGNGEVVCGRAAAIGCLR